MNFETWFKIFSDHLVSLGWTGPIDEDSAKEDFEKGIPAEVSAGELGLEYGLLP